MRHFALIGRALTHSYSKQLFDAQHFADADYRLCPMPSLDGLRQWVRREGIDGFNVTVPYKRDILPLLDALSPEAAEIGAVNCVVVSGGRLTGHNTDAPAFLQTLLVAAEASSFSTESDLFSTEDGREGARLSFAPILRRTKDGLRRTNDGLRRESADAVVLGTGGAARAVAYALRQLGLEPVTVSRTPHLHPGSVGYDRIPSAALLVNATPVGMHPDAEATPLDLRHSPLRFPLVYDLVYNPSPTLLMRQAAAKGSKVTDGLAMLRRQAELSWQLFGLQQA